jgi:mannose-6-phosphate isomerase-like protein (cupin superfamily)
MANFRLGPGLITIGVHHRTVDEVWYVTGGKGHIWRAPGGKPEEGKIDRLEPGVSVAIPVGTHFQFRADEQGTLDIIGVDTPVWPGDDEAVLSTIAPWTPSVGKME